MKSKLTRRSLFKSVAGFLSGFVGATATASPKKYLILNPSLALTKEQERRLLDHAQKRFKSQYADAVANYKRMRESSEGNEAFWTMNC
jgi:hypothetical protein